MFCSSNSQNWCGRYPPYTTYSSNKDTVQYHTSSTETSHIRNVFFQLLTPLILLQDERISILCYMLLIYLTPSQKVLTRHASAFSFYYIYILFL